MLDYLRCCDRSYNMLEDTFLTIKKEVVAVLAEVYDIMIECHNVWSLEVSSCLYTSLFVIPSYFSIINGFYLHQKKLPTYLLWYFECILTWCFCEVSWVLLHIGIPQIAFTKVASCTFWNCYVWCSQGGEYSISDVLKLFFYEVEISLEMKWALPSFTI